MNSTTKHINGIGAVLFEKSGRAKRMNISIRPSRGVRVAVPRRVSFKEAEEFVHAKSSWIRKHLSRMKMLEIQWNDLNQNHKPLDKASSQKKLIHRLQDLAEINGFTYNKVFIKNQKTRWGSCSSQNNINLNAKLANLPDELMDYVILHELVHTKIKNHSKKFWTELDKFVGNAKALDKELRKYGLVLF